MFLRVTLEEVKLTFVHKETDNDGLNLKERDGKNKTWQIFKMFLRRHWKYSNKWLRYLLNISQRKICENSQINNCKLNPSSMI